MNDGFDIKNLVAGDGTVDEEVLAGISPEELIRMLRTKTPCGSLALVLARNGRLDEEFHTRDVLHLDRNEVAHELARSGRLPDSVLEDIALEDEFENADGEKLLYSLIRFGRLPDCLRATEILDEFDDGLPGRLLRSMEGEHPDETLRKRIMEMAEALSRRVPTNERNSAPDAKTDKSRNGKDHLGGDSFPPPRGAGGNRRPKRKCIRRDVRNRRFPRF